VPEAGRLTTSDNNAASRAAVLDVYNSQNYHHHHHSYSYYSDQNYPRDHPDHHQGLSSDPSSQLPLQDCHSRAITARSKHHPYSTMTQEGKLIEHHVSDHYKQEPAAAAESSRPAAAYSSLAQKINPSSDTSADFNYHTTAARGRSSSAGKTRGIQKQQQASLLGKLPPQETSSPGLRQEVQISGEGAGPSVTRSSYLQVAEL
jgi:hypothetical protein